MEYSHYKQRIQTMLKEIDSKIVTSKLPISDFRYMPCDYKKGNECPVLTEENSTAFTRENTWGGALDLHAWFYTHLTLPKRHRGRRMMLQVQTQYCSGWDASNPQFIIYFNGQPVQGLDINHTRVILPNVKELDIHVYAYSGTVAGTWRETHSNPLYFYADIIEIDETAEAFWYDLQVPTDVLQFINENTKECQDIAKYLNNALNLLDWRDDEKLRASFAAAREYLRKEFYETYCQKSNVKVKCIGSTHIDIGWLWRIRQTVEKAQRSFLTVLNLMKQYPDYKFMSSQVPLYKAIKEEMPEQYEEIKQRVKEGRWEVEGAMYVEADCNLTSGESLVRQILYGKKFFQDEFGVDSKVLWLPDVFGYSAALPQILQKSGVDKFVTSKISWNDTNKMPHDTFMWKGIDGTEIFTHFMTAQNAQKDGSIPKFTTYLPRVNASYTIGAWRRNQDKDYVSESMLTFGYGDGGGGPTANDLEMFERMSHGIPTCPTTEIQTATEYLAGIEKQSKGKLAKWCGELYFEYHRGTYTSQAQIKQDNRKTEFALQNAETYSSLANIQWGTEYPKEQFDMLWEDVLINQFHDILPGTSIKEVYDDAAEMLDNVKTQADSISMQTLKKLAENVRGKGLLIFNPTSFVQSGTICVNGQTRFVENIPAKGYAVREVLPFNGSVSVTEEKLENDFFVVELNEKKHICRLYDKRNKREILPKGKTGNRLVAYEDFPHAFDAWELRKYYKEKAYPIDSVDGVELIYDGERSGIKIVRNFENSVIRQTIWLYEHLDRIDIDNDIDWQTEHLVLKDYFPVDVNTEKATFDIQFGNYERPIHENTSWDEARFESCAHKFVDLSDSGYGMALLNDCKYGYSISDGEIGATILKCSTYPDLNRDKGNHKCTYSLYPHKEDARHSDVYKASFLLNNPLQLEYASGTGSLPSEYSYVQADKENLIIDTMKRAEQSNDIIIRAFEALNRSGKVKINFGFDVKEVYLCDLQEKEIAKLIVSNNTIELDVKSFEILTLKIVR